MNKLEAEQFVKDVERHLGYLRQQEGLPTQDELDIFLLGGTVPAHPLKFGPADIDCSACWGRGTTCVCHGQGACRSSNRERCKCTIIRR